jgi:hypothetical protein
MQGNRPKRKTADLSTALRSGRDDKSVATKLPTFPGKTELVLKMNCHPGQATCLWQVVKGKNGELSGPFNPRVLVLCIRARLSVVPKNRPQRRALAPVCIYKHVLFVRSADERSAVQRTFIGHMESRSATNLSSRPERSGVERSAVSRNLYAREEGR